MLSSTTFRSYRLATQVISRRQPAVPVQQHIKDFLSRRLLTSNSKDVSPAKEGLKNKVLNESGSSSSVSQMWNRFIGPKEIPPRWTAAWYREMVLICTVFAITGTSTMVLVSWEIPSLSSKFVAHPNFSLTLSCNNPFLFHLGPAGGEQGVGFGRKLERWSLVVSYLFPGYHDSHLCLSSCGRRNCLWSSSLLSSF